MRDGPDVLLGPCPDCLRKGRLFEIRPGHLMCKDCLAELVESLFEYLAREAEEQDAPS